MRVTTGRPYLIEVGQVDIDDRAQGSGVTNRRDAVRGSYNLRRGAWASQT